MSAANEYHEYGFVAEYYDHVVPYREREDLDFYIEMAKEEGGPVLELGCGTGRVLIPTARAGVEITGVDVSREMLAVCEQRLAQEPDEVRARVGLQQADMRAFDLGRTFRLATIPFRPFQHLQTVQDQLDCLACLRRHLEPGGRLVFDLFNPSMHALTRDNLGEEIGDEPEFVMPDGRRVVRTHRIVARDYFQQVTQVELIYNVTHPDGREERLVQAFPMRYLFRYEAEHLLARAGFMVEQLYAGFDKSPFGSKDPGELIFIARR